MTPVQIILHPTDFSECSKCAFELASSLARDYNARLIVLHVGVPPTPMVPDVMLAADTEAFEKNLSAQLDKIRPPEARIHCERRLDMAADAVAEILRVAEHEQCDLIVMGTHGRTGLRHVLLGSVAERVVRQASCPVVTIRSPMRGLGGELGSPEIATRILDA